MSKLSPTDAEKAMGANARSRVEQGVDSDAVSRQGSEAAAGTPDSPSSTDLMGPGGDPAEGKR